MSLAILFHFLCAQHVSDINISIIRSLRLFCWITTLVVLFLVRCVLEFRCGWVGVVSVLQASACYTETCFFHKICVIFCCMPLHKKKIEIVAVLLAENKTVQTQQVQLYCKRIPYIDLVLI